jgi:hypothetical protein
MTTLTDLYPSKYLKGADLDGDTNFVIDHHSVVELGDDRDLKPILFFKNCDKAFVLNQTNCKTISKLHGPVLETWTGKAITLYATEVEFGGTTTLGIRVRLTAPQVTRKPVAAPIVEEELEVPEFAGDPSF